MRDEIIEMERATVAAYKAKDVKGFTQFFSKNYIGLANDGVKTAADEVEKMRTIDAQDISIEGEKVSFPSDDVGVLTYNMKFKADVNGQPMAGTIYASTVYAREDGAWRSVLHTESLAS
jgi:ketosteroid isomerase-like protein